jgi:thiamine transport system permease protein
MDRRVAGRDGQLIRPLLPGFIVLGAVGALVAAALSGMIGAAGALDPAVVLGNPYYRGVIRFTLWQASLSTLLSVAFALPIARALARRAEFPGRALLLRLFMLPIVMPTLVAILGIIAVYGRAGWFSQGIALAGGSVELDIYGVGGILVGHVFFNLPLAVRLLLPVWESIPEEYWRLAGQLGMGSREVRRVIEWPLVSRAIPGVAGVIFMLCFTSFPVVLLLGGGPAATTMEVAIFQSVRFDFDLERAAVLALLQIGICAVLVGGGFMLVPPLPRGQGLRRAVPRPDAAARSVRIGDGVWLALGMLFVGLPVAAVFLHGLSGPVAQVLGEGSLWRGAALSVALALGASGLSLVLGIGLSLTLRHLRFRRYAHRRAAMMEAGGSLMLVVPPLALGTGLYVLLSPYLDVLAWAPLFVVLLNACLCLPYVLRSLEEPMQRIMERQDRLARSLGIAGANRLRLVEWPVLRKPLGRAAALSAALAVGDLGVIALFGTPETATLPLLLYQRLAAYQFGAAAVMALVLLGLCLAMFVVLERVIGGHARA